MVSPGLTKGVSTAAVAATPEAKVSAGPPSRRAIASSSAAQVGLSKRPYWYFTPAWSPGRWKALANTGPATKGAPVSRSSLPECRPSVAGERAEVMKGSPFESNP
jgi:hypothetical protein